MSDRLGIATDVARAIRLVIFDVDGVLTDGGTYMGPDGTRHERKRFHLHDGLGMRLLQSAGIDVVMVSGRVSAATTARATELGIECHQDPRADKLPLVEELRRARGLEWDAVAMLADDLPDAAVFTRVGLPAAVADAVPLIRDTALWVGERRGGEGVVREFCDALLEARGELLRVVEGYIDRRGGVGMGPAGRRWPRAGRSHDG